MNRVYRAILLISLLSDGLFGSEDLSFDKVDKLINKAKEKKDDRKADNSVNYEKEKRDLRDSESLAEQQIKVGKYTPTNINKKIDVMMSYYRDIVAENKNHREYSDFTSIVLKDGKCAYIKTDSMNSVLKKYNEHYKNISAINELKRIRKMMPLWERNIASDNFSRKMLSKNKVSAVPLVSNNNSNSYIRHKICEGKNIAEAISIASIGDNYIDFRFKK